MSSTMLKMIEAFLVIGGVLGFAVHQLVSVRRQIREDRARAEAAGKGSDAGH